MNNETYDWLDTEAALAERPAGFWFEHVKHRQEQDLAGLTLQASNTNVLDNESETSKEAIEAMPQEQIWACPVHAAVLSRLSGDTDLPNQEPAPMPIERYVAEGLAERYALLSLSQAETGGEWARYSACICDRK
jgi:hypothetical protein